jgi:hypothetical protein
MSERKVMVVGVPQHILQKVRPSLRDTVVTIEPRAAKAKELLQTETYTLVILGYPLVGADVKDLLDAAKSEGGPNKNATLILFAMPGKMQEAIVLHGPQVSKVLAMEEKPLALQASLKSVYRMSPRIQFRILVQVSVVDSPRPENALCQMADVSSSGALLCSARLFTVGTQIRIDFMLPMDRNRLRISAEVVRHTALEGGKEQGMGIRFTSFEADAQDRLKAFLEKKI